MSLHMTFLKHSLQYPVGGGSSPSSETTNILQLSPQNRPSNITVISSPQSQQYAGIVNPPNGSGGGIRTPDYERERLVT